MKRTFLIILTLIMILSVTSCTGGSDVSAGKHDRLPGTSSGTRSSVTISIPTIHKSATQWNFELFRDKYDDTEGWQSLLKEEYGIDISLNYIAALYAYDIANSKYYIDKINNGELDGLILVEYGNFNNITNLRDAGLIYPLDELLAGNTYYNMMPEEMRNAYKLPDGNIWALPAGYNHSLYSRRYNKEWLDKLGVDVPNSLESFYDVSKKFTYGDPNGNGLKDETGLAGKNWSGPEIFGDIFLANDCYLSNFFQSSVAYDYSTGAYEDAALKPEMSETLAFIKSMLNEKIAVIMQSDHFLTNGLCGSYYSLSSELPSDEWVTSYSLIPEKPKSAMGKGPERCLLLTSNTEDAEKTINHFVDSFYSETKGAAMGRFGIPGKNYEMDGSTFTIKDGPYIDIISDLQYLTENQINKVIDTSGNVYPDRTRFYQTYSSLYNKGQLIIDIGDFLPGIGGTDAQWWFGGIFTWYFLDVYDSLGSEEFLSYYKNEVKKIGIQDMLDKLNEEAGTVAKYRYD